MDDERYWTSDALKGKTPGGIDLTPAPLLMKFWRLFGHSDIQSPIIDLACGRGQNGIFLATKGIPVLLIDRSAPKLEIARQTAQSMNVSVATKRLDLEKADSHPLPAGSADGMIVFRYLHRPLMPEIKRALTVGGILIYETYTRDQAKHKRPKNPAYLLKPGELKRWFEDWEIIHYDEGTKHDPEREIAQIVCRKPVATQS